MNAADIKRFLASIDAKNIHVSKNWIRCCCPLAEWHHASGKDSHPSFAIKVEPNGDSFFTCFTCFSGPLIDLVYRLRDHGVDIALANSLVVAEMESDVSLHIHDWQDSKPKAKDFYFSEIWWGSFDGAWSIPVAREYLTGRGVTEHLCSAFDIRWDVNRGTVCFPVRNRKGLLIGVRGRHIAPNSPIRYYAYRSSAGEHNRIEWLGEDSYDPESTVLMVESVFDAVSVYRVYHNILAPLSVGLTHEHFARLAGVCDVVTLFDTGTGGDKARAAVTKHMPHAAVRHLIPSQKDPGEMGVDALIEVLGAYLTLTVDNLNQ